MSGKEAILKLPVTLSIDRLDISELAPSEQEYLLRVIDSYLRNDYKVTLLHRCRGTWWRNPCAT